MRALLLLPLVMGASIDVHPIDWQDNQDGRLVTIRVVDEITPGDLDKIKAALSKALREHRVIVALEMGSWGGDGATGLQIADYVYRRGLKVLVQENCFSACAFPALVALARSNLWVRGDAMLGVHQARDTGSANAAVEWTIDTAMKLHSVYGVPLPLLRAMVETPPDEMHGFDLEELREVGAIMLPDSFDWPEIE